MGQVASFTTDDLTRVLLLGSGALLLCVAAVRLSVRSGLPTLLLYLGVGVLIGEAGLGVRFDDPNLTQVLGYSALVLILAEGGLSTRWSSIRASIAPAVVLSTVGVVVSVAVVAIVTHLLLGLSLQTALLIGAILSSTDAAAVFSVLRSVPLPPRLRGMLEAEAGFNDAPVVLLVVTLAGTLTQNSHATPWWVLVLEAIGELAGGALIGLAVGWGGAWLLRRVGGASSGLLSIGVIGLTVLAYSAADTVHTSGFIACYLSALLLGNLRLPHRAAISGFATAMGWIAQIGLFVLLGLLASPARLSSQLVPAVVVGLVLLLLARPLSVLVSMIPFRFSVREQAFLSWAGLRGAVPVVLATVPASVGAGGTEWMFDLVFMLVVVFTLVQGPTLPWLAHRLGVSEQVAHVDLAVEATPLDELGAKVVQVQIGEKSRIHGMEVFELRLPLGAHVTLIVRDGESFVPQGGTMLRRGDQLLVVTTSKASDQVEARLRAVSASGRLAGWFDGHGGSGGRGEKPQVAKRPHGVS